MSGRNETLYNLEQEARAASREYHDDDYEDLRSEFRVRKFYCSVCRGHGRHSMGCPEDDGDGD